MSEKQHNDIVIKYMIQHIEKQSMQLLDNVLNLSNQIKDLQKQCNHTQVTTIQNTYNNTEYYTCDMCRYTSRSPLGDMDDENSISNK